MPGTNKGTNNDKFYTPPDTVNQLLTIVDNMQALDSFKTIIEPSAGDGAILKPLRALLAGRDYTGSLLAYDLLPDDASIVRRNWLEPKDENGMDDDSIYDDGFEKQYMYDSPSLVIGNPPFGKNGSLALKFINESACFADLIAFIVPLSFMKASRQHLIDSMYAVRAAVPVDDDRYILPDGGYRSVPTCILILGRLSEPRVDAADNDGIDSMPFEFCEPGEADYMIVRVGGSAGRLKPISEMTDKNMKYNYFIRVTDNNANIGDIMAKAFRELKEIRDLTAGPRSVSKQELMSAVRAVINS